MEKEDIINKIIGIYKILYECDYKTKCNHKIYHVKCIKCGWESNLTLHDIKRAKNCTHKDIFNNYKKRFSWENKTIEKKYNTIKNRCYNKNDDSYKFYGAKGIGICKEWLNYPPSFEKWALNNGYKDNLTIDRINSNKDYSPENCRWVSAIDNSKYKSTTKIMTVDDISHTGREWAEVLDLGTNVINTMLREYPEDKVKEFISKRMKDKTIIRKSKQNWLDAYNL